MVCELKIKELEKQLRRKLNEREKKKIKEKMHHVEVEDDDYKDKSYEENKELEEAAIAA